MKLILSPLERERLQEWAQGAVASRALGLRSRIILDCAGESSLAEVGLALGVSTQTVGKWRRRFLAKRVDGLLDTPRSGAPRRITGVQIERVLAMTLETQAAETWSTRKMAIDAGMSQSAVARIWSAFGVQPRRSEAYRLSTNPRFVGQVQGLVGLYLNPPDRAFVLCLGAGPRGPASRHHRVLPVAPIDIKAARVTGAFQLQSRNHGCIRFLESVDRCGPVEVELCIVLDDAGTREAPSIRRWLRLHPRFQVHVSPTRASWLNLVERWFGLLNGTPADLARTIDAYLDHSNSGPEPFRWTAPPSFARSWRRRQPMNRM